MIDQAYFHYCEEMWSNWIQSKIDYPPSLRTQFQLEYCPEPYLEFFNNSSPRLHFLTTNPGAGMPHQNLRCILEGRSKVEQKDSYSHNAKRLADFYDTTLKGNAGVRVQAMKRLSGSQGFTQLECIPFHSKNLRNKPAVLRLCTENEALRGYIAHLTDYLADKDVMAVSAVSTRKEIACEEGYFSDWLLWQARIMGFSFAQAEKHDIVLHKGTHRVTGALLLSRSNNARKAFFLMMGTNSLPGAEGISKIADILSRR